MLEKHNCEVKATNNKDTAKILYAAQKYRIKCNLTAQARAPTIYDDKSLLNSFYT